MTAKQQLLERLQSREALIAVIGMGYVGLPLAVEAQPGEVARPDEALLHVGDAIHILNLPA